MKHLLLLLLLSLAFSCKKEEESPPNPDLGAAVEGTYVANRIGYNGQYTVVPTSTATAAILVIKTGLAEADLTVLITLGGDTSRDTYSTTLTKSGEVITMNVPTSATPTTIATVEADKIVFTRVAVDGSQTVVEGTKQ